MHENDIHDFKIQPYVEQGFDDQEITQLDFKRHLQTSIALDKRITMGTAGRPIKAEYYHNDVLMCRIDFTFGTDADNLMTSRTETLYYIRNDDTDGPAMIIKDKTYDPTSLSDGAIVMQERVQGRGIVIEEIKAFVAGVLKSAPYSMTITQILSTIQPFWDDHASQRADFIELGTGDFHDAIVAIDTAQEYAWMGYAYNLDGDTLQDYFVFRLSY